jgi:hypothetical protein
MISPVENSATPGATGAKSGPLRPASSPNICAGAFIFEAAIMRLRKGREKRMGTSDMVSTPPARNVSTCPTVGAARVSSSPTYNASDSTRIV